MPKANRYPRGYIVVTERDGCQGKIPEQCITALAADQAIEDLYKVYIGRMVNTNPWAYRKHVIEEAVKLFGNFSEWLCYQAMHNDTCYGLNWEFLLDTLQFIRTGHRNMSVFTWNEMLLENPAPKQGLNVSERLKECCITDPKEFDNFISDWLSQPNGFEDMVCTVHVLYGASKLTPTAPNTTRFKF